MIDIDKSRDIAARIDVHVKECFRNAVIGLSLVPEAIYVEGFAVMPAPHYLLFEHGWIESNGRIIDPTLYDDPPIAYFSGERYTYNEIAALFERGAVDLPIVWGKHSQRHQSAFNQALQYRDNMINKSD